MGSLGIDLKLLVVQVFNFLVLLLILKKWVYKPFVRFLDERAKKIHESLKASEKIRAEVKDFEKKKEEELAILREKSRETLEKVREEALIEKRAILDQTDRESRSILEEAGKQIEAEKKAAVKDLQKEVSDLSFEIVKKVLGDLDEEKAHRLIDQVLKEGR